MTAEVLLPATAVSLDAKVRFLSDPAAYSDREGSVERRETHMSWVFFAGERVYKLKKAVRFPYLDFSTLQRREQACRAELKLNRRLARDVYLEVAPLVVGDGGFSIGGSGEVIDWLVVMRRLDEAQTLEARLRNHVRAFELDHLAAALARFYRRGRPIRTPAPAYLAEWTKALAYNRRVLLDMRFGLPGGLVRSVDETLRVFLRVEKALLLRRLGLGRVIDAHGDLRPEHVWLSSPIRIIDCLEFSPALRANDPLDEIAFLDLECERLGAPEAGRRIRDRVLAMLNESRPGALYDFYRCHRAMIRARLAIAHLAEAAPRTPEKWRPLAVAYLGLALKDAMRLRRRLKTP